jgi:hypothetical protein
MLYWLSLRIIAKCLSNAFAHSFDFLGFPADVPFRQIL